MTDSRCSTGIEQLIEAEAKRRCLENDYTLEFLACQDRRFRHDDRRPWWQAMYVSKIEGEIERLEKAGFVVAPQPASVAQPQQFPCPECDNETACLNRASCAAPPAQPVPGGDKGEAVASPTRDAIAKALANHFKTTIEKHRGMPFPETGVFLPNESFDGYADAVLLLYATPQPASNAGGEVAARLQALVNKRLCACKASERDGQHMGWCPVSSTPRETP